MRPSGAFRLASAMLVLGAAVSARAWDELGTLAEARREHPGLFREGAVLQIEVDGVEHWAFAGDSDQRDGFPSLSDTERYAEAALDARRNLLRHVTGGARNVTAEVSGIVVAYRFADGSARRVVCLVPVENVRVVSASTPVAPPAEPPAPAAPVSPTESAAPAEPPAVPAAVSPAPATATAPHTAPTAPAESPSPAEPSPAPSVAAPHSVGTGLPRFSPPSLPVPVIP